MTLDQKLLRGYLVKTFLSLDYKIEDAERFIYELNFELENSSVKSALLNYDLLNKVFFKSAISNKAD